MWMGERRKIPIGRSCFLSRYVFLIVICCSQQRQVLECVGGLPRPIQPVAEHAFFTEDGGSGYSPFLEPLFAAWHISMFIEKGCYKTDIQSR